MLIEDYLDLKKIFPPEVLWEIRPKQLVGKIQQKFGDGRSGFIKLQIEIYYPDGKPMDRIFGGELAKYSEGDYVIFNTRDAKESEKIKWKQDNLQEAYNIKYATEEDIEKLPYNFDPAKIASLGRTLTNAIEDVTDKQMNLEREIGQRVDEQTKLRMQELDSWETTLKTREDQLVEKDRKLVEREEKVDQFIAEQVAAKKLELETYDAKLKLDAEKNERALNNIKQLKDELEGERNQLSKSIAQFHEQGGDKFISILGMLEDTDKKSSSLRGLTDVTPPKDLLSKIDTAFAKKNYFIDSGRSMQFLLSTLTSALTGQFVVLSGPTGVGKTSMVNEFAAALGAGKDVVPVRPSWIDPTDLLGFFNPQEERFQPSPFMDRFLDAQRCSQENRLYFLTLDEMNLSRVENYAADFLSLLEKARGGDKDACLQLYSGEIAQELKRKAKRLKEDGENNYESSVAILNHLLKYPPSIVIPEGLVMFGTVNLDETTYHLSPKFKDRSFVINISHQELLNNIPNTLSGQFMTEPIFEMSLNTVKNLVGEKQLLSPEVLSIWKTILDWRDDYLEPLGIRLGYRFASMFATYMKIADSLGLKDHYSVAGTFLQAKLLPWISFHKEDKAVGDEENLKIEVLQEWTDDQTLDNFSSEGGVRSSLEQIIERGNSSLIVQYLE